MRYTSETVYITLTCNIRGYGNLKGLDLFWDYIISEMTRRLDATVLNSAFPQAILLSTTAVA